MGKYVIESTFENTRCFVEIACTNREPYLFIHRVDSLTPYTEPEPHAEVTADAYQRGYETAKRECEDCPKQAYTDTLRMESYLKGLSDAWETVKELFNFTFDEQATIFKTTSVRDIVRKYSASETIEKMEAYEQEKEEQIQVGDEVTMALGKAVVTGVGPVHFEYVYADGSHGYDEVKNVTKTGRHFPEIAAVLAKMKENNDNK